MHFQTTQLIYRFYAIADQNIITVNKAHSFKQVYKGPDVNIWKMLHKLQNYIQFLHQLQLNKII